MSHGCPRDQLHRCVKTAEPLLRNPDYVFPSTTGDVAIVCRYRLPLYTLTRKKSDEILIAIVPIGPGTSLSIASEDTRRRAWRATDACSNCRVRWKRPSNRSTRCALTLLIKQVSCCCFPRKPAERNGGEVNATFSFRFQDYLRHAPCIKSMATDETKCRKQLSFLVDQVSALSISNIQICW